MREGPYTGHPLEGKRPRRQKVSPSEGEHTRDALLNRLLAEFLRPIPPEYHRLYEPHMRTDAPEHSPFFEKQTPDTSYGQSMMNSLVDHRTGKFSTPIGKQCVEAARNGMIIDLSGGSSLPIGLASASHARRMIAVGLFDREHHGDAGITRRDVEDEASADEHMESFTINDDALHFTASIPDSSNDCFVMTGLQMDTSTSARDREYVCALTDEVHRALKPGGVVLYGDISQPFRQALERKFMKSIVERTNIQDICLFTKEKGKTDYLDRLAQIDIEHPRPGDIEELQSFIRYRSQHSDPGLRTVEPDEEDQHLLACVAEIQPGLVANKDLESTWVRAEAALIQYRESSEWSRFSDTLADLASINPNRAKRLLLASDWEAISENLQNANPYERLDIASHLVPLDVDKARSLMRGEDYTAILEGVESNLTQYELEGLFDFDYLYLYQMILLDSSMVPQKYLNEFCKNLDREFNALDEARAQHEARGIAFHLARLVKVAKAVRKPSI